MHKNIIAQNKKEPPQHKIYVVHPQCRGYVHRTVFIFNSLQNHNSDLRTQLQIFSITQKLRTKVQIISSKTLCALSCRGHPHTQLGLNLKSKNRP